MKIVRKIIGIAVPLLLGLQTHRLRADELLPESHYHPKLRQAHQEYLDGQSPQAMQSIKALLMDETATEVERQNAYGLYSAVVASLDKTSEKAVDWVLPAEIQSLRISVTRRDNGTSVKYRLGLKGTLTRERALQQVQVTKYPDRVLMDKRAGIGEYEDEVWEGVPEFSITADGSQAHVEAGLYLIAFETGNGSVTQGWFVITPDMNATTSPVLHSPVQDDVVQGPNPVVQLDNYVSPQFNPEREYRSLWMDMGRVWPDNDNWEFKWGFYAGAPGRTSYTLGEANDNQGAVAFEPGLYHLSVAYSESHKLADRIKMVRVSRAQRVFRIR